MNTSQVHVNIYADYYIAEVHLGAQEIRTLDLSNPQLRNILTFSYFLSPAFTQRLSNINSISISYFGTVDEIALMQGSTSGSFVITKGNIEAFRQQTNDIIRDVASGLLELLRQDLPCPLSFALSMEG